MKMEGRMKEEDEENLAMKKMGGGRLEGIAGGKGIIIPGWKDNSPLLVETRRCNVMDFSAENDRVVI
jgi:hypothetical protein